MKSTFKPKIEKIAFTHLCSLVKVNSTNMKHKVCPCQPCVCFINPKLFNRMVHYKKISYQDCTMYIESRTFQLKGKYRARNLRLGMQSLVFTCIFLIRSNFFFVHFYYSSNACYSELNRPLSFYFVLFILYKNT